MPELPEVETVKRTLNELITGKTIESVEVRLPRIIQKPDDPHVFAQWLAGRTFQKVERRGKFLSCAWTILCSSPICGWKADTAYFRPMSR